MPSSIGTSRCNEIQKEKRTISVHETTNRGQRFQNLAYSISFSYFKMSHKKLHYAIEGLQSLNQTATLGLLGGLTRTTLVTCAEDGDSKVERVHDSSEEVGRFHEESSLLLVQPMDLSCQELMRMLLDINITSRTTKRCSQQKLQQRGDEADGETVLPLAIVQRITSYLTVVPVCHEDAHVVGSSSSHTMDELDQWNLDGNTTTLSKTGTMRIKGESSEWIQYSFSRNGNKVVRLASIKLLVLPPSRVPQVRPSRRFDNHRLLDNQLLTFLICTNQEESLAIRNFRLQTYNVERCQWTSISPLMQIEAKTK